MHEAVYEGLPRSLVPVNYHLQISDIDLENNRYNGKVKIELDCVAETDVLVLNSKLLEIVEVVCENHKVQQFYTEEREETLTIQFDSKITPNENFQVSIAYVGKIQTNMTSFYRSNYKNKLTGESQVCLCTQFEAASARLAFPCLDEPNFKATFEVELHVDSSWIALSNMPVKGKPILADKPGTNIWKFEKSVKMSTYLAAWACGDFEYIETQSLKSYPGHGHIPIKVYTAKGLKEQGNFALSVAAKTVDYFSEIFEIDYCLPKLDLISIPDFSHGAMENYGLITFRESTLLHDPKRSDTKSLKNIAYVVCHECAHQWFGNLVTMNWWNELWLNEGFATWVGSLAVSVFFPEWDYFTAFVSTQLQVALALDSLRGSHPVEVPIHRVSDISQVFDTISYLKGASVINMLSDTLGVEVFLKGVANYLKKNKFQNATTTDLWDAISETSGVDINLLMTSWIGKIGFPYVTVSLLENGKISLKQNRFLSSGDTKPEEDETLWWIPLNVSTFSLDQAVRISLKDRETQIEAQDFLKINKDSYGFYRVCYDESLLQQILDHLDSLGEKDKIGLIADTASSAIASFTKTSALFEIIKAFSSRASHASWTEIIKRLSNISKVWYEQPLQVREGLEKFERVIFEQAIENIGFDKNESDDYLTQTLRCDLLLSAGTVGVSKVVAHAVEIFEKWQQTGEIEPSLMRYVFKTVLSQENATLEQFDLVHREIVNPSGPGFLELAIESIGCVTSEELKPKLLELLLSDSVHPMNIRFLAKALGENNSIRWQLWEFIETNYEALFKRLSQNLVVLDWFLKGALDGFSSFEAYEKISKFFEDKPKEGFNRGLVQTLDQIKTHAAWVDRDAEDVYNWLKANQYLCEDT